MKENLKKVREKINTNMEEQINQLEEELEKEELYKKNEVGCSTEFIKVSSE